MKTHHPFSAETPVLILGGKENSLSVVRHLGGLGVPVSCSGAIGTWGLYSRLCDHRYVVPAGQAPADYWANLLLGAGSPVETGTVLFPCSDEALRFIAEHHDALARHFVFDEAPPEQRLAMLDKQRTLEIAREAGVDAPSFWSVNSDADLEKLRGKVAFPVMVKPIDSYRFAQTFHRKLFIIQSDFSELAEKVHLAWDKGHDVMVVEMVPGPDDLLSSYYTYMTGEGRPLFHFTKRVLRRYPVNSGGATFHLTEWLPETADAGLRFFEGSGFRGLGNIEFKRDIRDGKLKVIEVNARFTAAQELALRAGMPIDLIKYCHLTGQSVPVVNGYREGLRYWYPVRDTLAFMELNARGDLTFGAWLQSLKPDHNFVSPLHSKADLFPSVGAAYAVFQKAVGAWPGGSK
ncbi:MAG: hypothetical protein KDJ77_04670 [Rhodobiaceae bacterium]|nr:hypothetical protein [Rhodobiaceae bacterium]